MTDSERWRLVQQAFEAAIALPPHERIDFVRVNVPQHSGARQEVLRLLAAFEAPGPLDRLLAELHPAPAPPEAQPPARIGVWRIEELIDHGGMGSVYRAERDDGQFVQRAALKLLRRDVIDADLRRRFLAERRILARIEHPGIARILDGGVTDEGRPWFALEFVEGLPIDEWCRTHELDVRARLALFREVCAAVAHAHAHLVVHRDLKPANILVTDEGHIRLLDFGIARLMDEHEFPDDSGRTHEGRLLLTPTYASPEQLRGETVGTASDVFQLGILLFELLTDQLPRRHDAVARDGATIRQRPSQIATEALRGSMDGDLDTIVLAATRAEPELRYASVERLSADVLRWLQARPIEARPDTFVYRADRFIRRNRVAVGVAGTLLVLLLTLVVVALVQGRRADLERDRARTIIALLAGLAEPPVAGPTANPAVAPPVATDDTTFEAALREALDRGDGPALARIASRLSTTSPVLRRAQRSRIALAGARILWVDDVPSANDNEILLFRSLGAHLQTAVGTEAAIRSLQSGHWDVVLSDMLRDGRPDAGVDLLMWLQRNGGPPIVFYVGATDTTRDRPAGSFGLTNRVDELIHLVLDVLERRRS